MKKRRLLIEKVIIRMLIFSLLTSGCSHNIVRDNYKTNEKYYKKINEICKNKDTLFIKIYKDIEYKGKELVMENDSTVFLNIVTNELERLKTNDIEQIEFDGTGTGVFEGLVFGALGGGGIGSLFFPDSHEMSGFGVIIAIGIGALIGVTIGIFSNNSTAIYFSK